jgi:energy-coupling factor transport system substrate-specific component
MLSVLSVINAALWPLGPGPPGSRPSSSSSCWPGAHTGPASGSRSAARRCFAYALLNGGVGPCMPYQMFGCAWVGTIAGLLPPLGGKAEIAMLAA